MQSDDPVSHGNPIDPYVCPRGHHSVRVNATRINCLTCRNQGHKPTSWDRSELIDLRDEEPPLQDERTVMADGGTVEDCADRSADEWEQYLEEHPDEVVLFVDSNYEIHTFEHEPEKGELTFLRGGTYGYDYDGSRAALEAFVDDDAEIYKLVSRDEEYAEREQLTDGEFDTPQEWVEA